MNQSTELDLGPLTWVKSEIDLALARADKALGKARHSPEAQSDFQFAQTHVHQACGALSIVGLDGLTQFASTLDRLLGMLARGERKADEGTIAIASRALASIANYLEELVRGTPDQPMRLMPLYSEIVAAQGEKPASPSALFFPDLSRRPTRRRPTAPMAEADWQELLRKSRTKFERGLLQWLKNSADTTGPAAMQDAASELEALFDSPALAALWWAAQALFTAIAHGDLAGQVAVRRVCTQLDRELRQLQRNARTVPDALMRELLYWIGQAPVRTEHQAAVREVWALDALIPEPEATVTEIPLAPLLKTLNTELGACKRAWNEFCDGQAIALPRFESHVGELTRLAAALERPAFDRLLAGIGEFGAWLRKDPLKFQDAIAIEVATALLLAEVSLGRGIPESGFNEQVRDTLNRLDALSRGEAIQAAEHSPTVEAARKLQEKQAKTQVAREILSNLGQVEQTLDDFFRNQAKRAPLAGLSQPLKQIEGALTLLGEDEAIALVRQATDTVARLASKDAEPVPGEFESLAQRLSALGFYVDALQHGPATLDRFLEPARPTRAEAPLGGAGEAAAERAATMQRAPEAPGIFPFTETTDQPWATPEPVEEAGPLAATAGVEEFDLDLELEPVSLDEALEASEATPGLESVPFGGPTVREHAAASLSDDAIDAELLDIFLEEAREVLSTITEQLDALTADPSDGEALTSVRRGFHTLKGSGRMVGLTELGEAAWSIEQTLNRWLQLELPPSDALMALLSTARPLFADWVEQIASGRGHARDVSSLVAEAERLSGTDDERADTGVVAPSATAMQAAAGDTFAAPAEAPVVPLETEEDLPDDRFELEHNPGFQALDEALLPERGAADARPALEAQDFTPEDVASPGDTPEQAADLLPEDMDQTEPALPADTSLESILRAGEQAEAPVQADETAGTVMDFGDLEAAPESGTTPTDAALTEEGQREAEFAEPTDVTEPTEFAEPAQPAESAETPTGQTGGTAHDEATAAEVEPVDAHTPLAAETPSLDEPPEAGLEAPPQPGAAATVRLGDADISRALLALYLGEAQEHIATLHDALAQLQRNPTLIPSESLLRAVHTLAGISGTAHIESIHRLARALEHATERLREFERAPSAEQTELMRQTTVTLEAMVADVAAERLPLSVPELEAQLDECGRMPDAGQRDVSGVIFPRTAPDAFKPIPALAQGSVPEPSAPVHDDLDEQLLPLFLEEGRDLLGELHTALRLWRDDVDSIEASGKTARLLHTLKGSARMAGAMRLGEHVHQLESRLELALKAGRPTAALIEELVGGLDAAEQMIEQIAHPRAPEAVAAAATDPDELALQPDIAGTVAALETAPAPDAPGGGASLRVRADLVDRFVNEAGEIGIARTRIEGELRTLRRSMLDLTDNVIRLRNQLREVEIQAELQMQSRIAQAESEHADFDPLEMDRYTRLQELTRMMTESVGDVTTVQQNLLRNLDGAELALNSQARLSRDLQQALMQVRMVPFESLADRLHRVVRQSAKELGKRVNLDLRGGRIEVDRSVLERMTAPLEHLLRNAVAHGMESAEEREAAGKDPIGEIMLSVSQEGNEIAITLRDDGRGLDHDAILARAREKGLVGADEVVDERRLTNLIFVPGFSTASSVSTVSGRGVGMDVVKAETAGVGGRIDIQSVPGKGTEFRIYLPLTLAVTQALLVRAGARSYAIPSSMITQVMELRSDALELIIAEGGVEWQGQFFAYRFMPHLLGDVGATVELQRFNPLLLLQAGAQTLALHVEALRGNQEIVVKNAGPQLVRIVGITGATVLGDGEIVLILNPVALASRNLTRIGPSDAPAPQQPMLAAPTEPPPPTVMIVDDSLTVRKITGRLLEREGYRVISAKDGTDALEKLVDTVPDAILSDIEMPRMDGFDLVRNIRADARTQAVPVIMITSRLAEKHREYAMKVGANQYLGKPYDEEELLGLLKRYISGAP
ncbi:Hpt domain-containing protein [Rhodocyclaceae bacterium SMB388]